MKIINIKNRRFDDHINYIVCFKKSDGIKINKLREIKSICQMIVRWQYYTPKKIGPTQCGNCMKFGHGSDNCYLEARCIRCGELHKSKECSYLTDKSKANEKIPNDKVKCANCGQQHTANFSKCIKRLEYIHIQSKFRTKQPQFTRQNSSFKPAPQLNDANFPNIPATQTRGQRDAWKQTNSTFNANNSRNQNISSENGNLLSRDELWNAFEELLHKLKSANTKEQQIRAVSFVIMKYCYDLS
jgi:hypothetical protein